MAAALVALVALVALFLTHTTTPVPTGASRYIRIFEDNLCDVDNGGCGNNTQVSSP